MNLARALGRTLGEIEAMPYYEAQLWECYLFPQPEAPESETAVFDGMCD